VPPSHVRQPFTAIYSTKATFFVPLCQIPSLPSQGAPDALFVELRSFIADICLQFEGVMTNIMTVGTSQRHFDIPTAGR
jgi:hypothetical protein